MVILFSVLSSWMAGMWFAEVFPNDMREWWNKWELRGLVFISLVSQIILALLGNRRKYGTNKVTNTIVWFTYLLADRVPTVALGVISRLGSNYDKHGQQMEDLQMMAFWAPFLLMHMGGPDTITAYSLEDNELWLRHLIGLVGQTLFTAYIILLFANGTSWLSWLSIPILIIGFFNYAERTWSHYSARINYCRGSHLSSTVMETEEISDEERFKSSLLHFNGFKGNFVSLISDMVYGTKDIELLKSMISLEGYEETFSLLNFQHGFWYDALFTKAIVTHNLWGCILRLVTSFATITVFILYIVSSNKLKRPLGVDGIITYMLLVVAIISEIFSFIYLHFYSEWTHSYLEFIGDIIQFPPQIFRWLTEWGLRRMSSWSTMGQCNFLNLLCCTQPYNNVGHSVSVAKLEKLQDVAPCVVSPELQQMLYDNALKKMASTAMQAALYRKVVKDRGLRRQRQIIENLEFHQSILLWHIVTTLCYHSDDHRNVPENENANTIHSRRESKVLFDYMFYLLVKKRHMLPIGAGLLTLRDSLFEANTYCEQHGMLMLPSDVSDSCRVLLQCIREDAVHRRTHLRPIGRSVFHYALLTANDFLTDQGNRRKMWKFLIKLWIEILYYGSAHCRVDRHAQEMSTGGEFISHIWLLQSVTGLLDQFHLSKRVLDDESN